MAIKNKTIKRGNRSIEKTIQEVFILVSLWLKLSDGRIHVDPISGRFIPGPDPNKQMDRELAARVLHTPKKSLNDYLLHIRYGRHFGFDFKKNKHARMGVLRKFVTIQKAKMQLETGCLRVSYIQPDEFMEDFDFLDLLEK